MYLLSSKIENPLRRGLCNKGEGYYIFVVPLLLK
nr:MAG TPA: hypothetical protein [Caudoviricetes sp.]